MYSMYPCLVLNFWFVYYNSLSLSVWSSLYRLTHVVNHSPANIIPPLPPSLIHIFTYTHIHALKRKTFWLNTNFCNISRARKYTPSIFPIPSLQAALLNPRSTLETNAITQIFPLAKYADLQGLLGSINLSLVIILYTQAKRVGR